MVSGSIPTVLIVEDQALIALELEGIAMDAGYAVLTKADHGDALDALDGNVVDFAVIDGAGSDGDKFRLAHTLASRGIPFAFCTGLPASEIPEDFRQATIVAKPFRDDDIASVLRAALSSPKG